MGSLTERLLDAGIRRSPLQPIFRWRSSRRLTVLAYHGIDRPERFEAHVRYLRRASHPVTLAEVLDAIDGRGALPKRAVLISFDDGDRTIFNLGLPTLRELQIPAVAFVVAGIVDTDEPFWWAEVQQLVAEGAVLRGGEGLGPADAVRKLKRLPNDRRVGLIQELRRQRPEAPVRQPQLRRTELAMLESGGIAVGNHSLSHPCLARCADQEVTEEIVQSHRILSGFLGHHPEVFAYPDGEWDDRSASALAGLGYRAAFLFDHRTETLPIRDPMRISRVRVNSWTSMDRLRSIVSGLHPTIHRLRGRR